MSKKANILYVEDDANLGFVTKDTLEDHGFAVKHCADGALALTAFAQQEFDLCILDVMLPKVDGFSLAETIRKRNPHIPILFLTAKSMKEDKLNGFRIGGDDYMTKPFSMEELILKMEVFLRRNRVDEGKTIQNKHFSIGEAYFDFENLQIIHPNEKVNLTLKEAELLRFFFLHANKVLKRDEILNSLWGDDDYFIGRSLDVFISRLRKYLSFTEQAKITTIHGVGFKFDWKP